MRILSAFTSTWGFDSIPERLEVIEPVVVLRAGRESIFGPY